MPRDTRVSSAVSSSSGCAAITSRRLCVLSLASARSRVARPPVVAGSSADGPRLTAVAAAGPAGGPRPPPPLAVAGVHRRWARRLPRLRPAVADRLSSAPDRSGTVTHPRAPPAPRPTGPGCARGLDRCRMQSRRGMGAIIIGRAQTMEDCHDISSSAGGTVRAPSAAARSARLVVAAAAVGAGALALLISWSVLDLVPHVGVSALFQGRILASGALYLPPPPLAGLFVQEDILLTDSRWCSIFPPAWPLLLALGWLLHPPWLPGPLLLGLPSLGCAAAGPPPA